jgi:phosphoribosylformylglycinamidine cyclo-ligase
MSAPRPPATYRGAGVDIDAGDALVERIKPHARRTMRPEVLGGIGGFASLVGLPAGYREPVLVSGTDGVGTKLACAFATGRHDTVGIDLVAMCVNDVAVTGAEPLFFLDYFATGKLSVDVAEAVIKGIAEGCHQAGCALVGGETAELPGFYQPGEYDLAGFAVGVVEKSEVWDGRRIQPGDHVLGLASAGLHSNGYSLTRQVVLERMHLAWDARPPELGGASIADELMRPTRIYVPALRALRTAGVAVGGAAHITGGGVVDNAPRCLPEGTAIELRAGSWPVPPIFGLIQRGGEVAEAEMRRTYNLGLGMIVVVREADAARARAVLEGAGESVHAVGRVVAHSGEPEARFA